MADPGLLVMRYAFPCAEISIQLGNITRKEYEEIEAALLAGRSLPQEKLEQFFPALTRRLKEVAERDGLSEYWSEDAIHTYFLKYHDEYIDKGDGMLGQMSPTEKELCRCTIGKVMEVKQEQIITLKTPNGNELVLGKYAGNIEEGDIVVSHRKFATEKLSAEQAATYGYP